MRTTLAGCLATGSLLFLSGCGGSSNSALSYSAFSTAANTICKSENAAAAKIGAGATGQASPANAAVIRKLIAAGDASAAKLKTLNGPAALNTARDTLVTAVDANAVLAKRAAAAAQAGHQSQYIALVKQLAATDGPSNADGSKLGAPACATG